MAERAPKVNPQNEMAPIVAIGGLLTIKRLAFWYKPLLDADTSTDLPASERFLAPPNRGIGEPDELQKHITENLENTYDQLDRRRMFLVGHSLGGLIATMAAVERPDLVQGVASLGGAHSGYSHETPATLALRHGLGNPKEARHLRHDSPFMKEHQERMEEDWPADVPLHIISSPIDVLVVPPQGYEVKLPEDRQPEKRLLVPPVRPLEWALRKRLGVSNDVKSLRTWHPTEHVNLPRVPAVVNYVHKSQLAIAGIHEHVQELPRQSLEPALAAA
jgi:hypothetical protein